MAKSKPRQRPSGGTRPASEAVLLESYRLKHRIWAVVQVVAYFVGIGIVLLCAEPMASTLAGKDTHVELKVSLAIGITLAGVAAALGAWGKYQQKQAKHLRRRNRALVERLRDAGVSIPDTETA
jgi:protein-S-isoprenylcysteine O-methyltransferase Ste14